MPYKANEARRHKIPRARYKVTNWPEYDRALQQRGSLTVWVTPEALAAWLIRDRGRMGWQKAVGYGRRSLGETAVFRYKTIIGRRLRARTLPSRKTEARA